MRGNFIAWLCALPLATACVDNLSHPADLPGYDATAAPAACVPNLDGKVQASELQPAFGVAASYRVTQPGANRAVDLAGYVDDAGHRIWDWSGQPSGDAQVHITATPLQNQWYASSFLNGQFVVPFDASGTVDSVYRQDDQALWLLGVASHEAAPAEGKTLLPYAEPVAVLRFPLQVGATWSSVGKTLPGKGILRGLPYASIDTYAVTVDATGRLELPDLSLTQVLRVRTSVHLQGIAGAPVTRKQASFVFECLGEVARATSEPGETQDDFVKTSEVRRLGL